MMKTFKLNTYIYTYYRRSTGPFFSEHFIGKTGGSEMLMISVPHVEADLHGPALDASRGAMRNIALIRAVRLPLFSSVYDTYEGGAFANVGTQPH